MERLIPGLGSRAIINCSWTKRAGRSGSASVAAVVTSRGDADFLLEPQFPQKVSDGA